MKNLEPITEYVMPLNYKDQFQLSLGAEYFVNEDWIVRGGYSFDQSAVPDETVKPFLPDYGSRHGLNAGVSLLLERWNFPDV